MAETKNGTAEFGGSLPKGRDRPQIVRKDRSLLADGTRTDICILDLGQIVSYQTQVILYASTHLECLTNGVDGTGEYGVSEECEALERNQQRVARTTINSVLDCLDDVVHKTSGYARAEQKEKQPISERKHSGACAEVRDVEEARALFEGTQPRV